MKERYKFYINFKKQNKGWEYVSEGDFYHCLNKLRGYALTHKNSRGNAMKMKIVQVGKIDVPNNGGIVK